MRGLCFTKTFEFGIIKIERQPPKQFVPIQSAAPLGALLHGAHIPISIVLRTCFLDAPATRWVAGFIVKRKSTLLLASFGVVFLCLDYLLNWNINVSNARINTPKAIRSLKSYFFISITSIPTEFRQRYPATRLSLLLYHVNIFLTRKTKNYRPRSFCCAGRSFCFVKLQAGLLNTAEQEA